MSKFQVTLVRPPVNKRLDRSVSYVVEANDPLSACEKARAVDADYLCAAVKKMPPGTVADLV